MVWWLTTEPDILECDVKWALESITTNKASGADGIPVEHLHRYCHLGVVIWDQNIYLNCYLIWLLWISSGKESAMGKSWVQSLVWEDPLEKGMATHSSILVRRIPWTEEPGRLQSMGLQRVGHDWVTNTYRYLKFDLLKIELFSPHKKFLLLLPYAEADDSPKLENLE